MPITAEYGTWKSPVTSDVLSQAGLRFIELQVDQTTGLQDTVYWAELRYAEEGRYVICSASAPNFENLVQWTPSGFSARTKVHEYGGGSFSVRNRILYFSNTTSVNGEPANRLFMQTSPTSEPRAISPKVDSKRYADICVTDGGSNGENSLVYAVCEDHGTGKSEPENYICVINPATSECHKLVDGADFFASPRVNGDRTRIAYVEWHHPCMPWDATQVRCARLTSDGLAIAAGSIRVCAGFDVTHAALHPSWLSNDTLAYVHDATGYWNVYTRRVKDDGEGSFTAARLFKPEQIAAGLKTEHAVLPRREDCGRPTWVFAQTPFAAAALQRGESGLFAITFRDTELITIEYRIDEHGDVHFGDKQTKIETGVYNHFQHIVYSQSLRDVFTIGAAGSRYASIVRISLAAAADSNVQTIKVSNKFELDAETISEPRLVVYETSDNQVSHAYYYAPRNKDYQAPPGTYPPMLVRAHGGPHGSSDPTLRLLIQYYTSRGFAVMDVNYRGSSLLGRKYRDALKNQWGIYDVEDCVRAAIYAVNHGLADRNRLCIAGGSAGGFLVLACLAFRNVFSAGSSLYGVADIEMLQIDTHKFESRYMEQLVGTYPPCIHLFRERSPINSVDKINCPLILFQGTDDKIVPPQQSICIYDAVKRKGLPTALLMFEGEGHGFCKGENVRTQIDSEYYFFTKMFGIDAPDLDHVKSKLAIDNLEWLATGPKKRDFSLPSSGASGC